MYQLLKFKHPIPSCEIHSLEFKENNWIYIYAVNTPIELTDKNTEELIIYQYISDLNLKLLNSVHPESINIKINSLTEYLNILNRQREADINYRKQWLLNNSEATTNTIKLYNKSYNYEELIKNDVHYIADMINLEKDYTIFAAI